MTIDLSSLIPIVASAITILTTIIAIYVRFSNKVERIEERLRGEKALIDQRHNTIEESVSKIEHRLDSLERAVQANTVATEKLLTTLENISETLRKK